MTTGDKTISRLPIPSLINQLVGGGGSTVLEMAPTHIYGNEEGGRDGGLGAAHVPRPHKLEVYSTKPGVSGESVTLSQCLIPNI